METSKYKDLFISEATEHLDNIDFGLVDLEKDPKNQDIITSLMRSAHTLKGISATMGYNEISSLTHSLESMLESIKHNAAAGQVGTLFGAVDELRRLIKSVQNPDIIEENFPQLQLSENDRAEMFRDLSIVRNPASIQKISDIRVRTEKLDKIMEITSEMVINKMQLSAWKEQSDASRAILQDKNAQLVDELQFQVLQLRLTPLAQVFNRFPRMIRDLSSKLDKKIDFVFEGGEIEIDGEILDEIGEPLVHLLRNAADHGIEKEGKITIIAERFKDTILIKVSDDGKGIDWQKLAEKSGKKDFKDPRDLLFMGVSTADKITELSGRGIGMGVVKNAIEKLGGHITVLSERGKGTTFIIELPVSMAIIKGLIVKAGEGTFVAPLSSVEKIYGLDELDVLYQADQPFTIVNEMEIPLIQLRSKLNYSEFQKEIKMDNSGFESVLLVRNENILYAFIVDQIYTQQDVVVKPLPDELRRVTPFSTATILGDGKPVPIIDFNVLI